MFYLYNYTLCYCFHCFTFLIKAYLVCNHFSWFHLTRIQPGGYIFCLNNLFFKLYYSTIWQEIVCEGDYEIWILPQELQSVDINLQSFWSNWCSAKEECNTSCCDVPCILFSTVSGHACHSPLQACAGTISWSCAVTLLKLNQGRLRMSVRKHSQCQPNIWIVTQKMS